MTAKTHQKMIARLPMPRGPVGATGVCTLAITLISAGSANIIFGMQGGAMSLARVVWTVAGIGVGAFLIYAFKCHTMIAAKTE